MNAIAIRPFEPAEWEQFRDFRLAALKASPGVFAASYEDGAARSPDEWRQNRGNDHQVFGLFDGSRLIGITAAFSWREDLSGQTAVLAMSSILPEYRGRDLSSLLYETRLAWIRDQQQFSRVVVSHRASNAPSRRANQRFGFVETHRTLKVWPDGTVEDEVFYELKLPPRRDRV